jgi:hypothetical protein
MIASKPLSRSAARERVQPRRLARAFGDARAFNDELEQLLRALAAVTAAVKALESV